MKNARLKIEKTGSIYIDQCEDKGFEGSEIDENSVFNLLERNFPNITFDWDNTKLDCTLVRVSVGKNSRNVELIQFTKPFKTISDFTEMYEKLKQGIPFQNPEVDLQVKI